MRKLHAILATVTIAACAIAMLLIQRQASARSSAQSGTTAADGYVVQNDKDVAKDEPGPHKGGGPSTSHVFFEKVPDLKFSFRKRVLHRGAAIGYHLQETDEVYYITSGTGTMTINGHAFPVKPGDAMLTRAGSSHGLVQTGTGDLSIIITYQK